MNITAALLCAAISFTSADGSSYLSQDRIRVACKYAPEVLQAAKTHEVSPFILAALIYYESSWYTQAKSSVGACGLTQVLPKYSQYTCQQLYNPRRSIREGAEKLRGWMDFTLRHDKVMCEKKALACYNAGYVCLGSSSAKQYSKKVIALAALYDLHAFYQWCEENPENEACDPGC